MIREKGREGLFELLFLIIASISIICVLVICIFLFGEGVPAITEIGLFDFLTGTDWLPTSSDPKYGILSMILGSLYITTGAIIVGVPIGILTAVYLTKYCSDKVYKILKPAIDLMAGIPSIIYGFFGMTVMVPFISSVINAIGDVLEPDVIVTSRVFYTTGTSIFTASILLGFMILPTVIGLSESAIKAVPDFYYEGARALGATHERTIFKVVLPAAKSGILASVVLGIGRAIGETMAVIMVAGNQARLTTNFFSGIRTMTANVVLEMGYAYGLHREALIATGVVLFVFILIINLCFSIIKRKVGN
ncbi:MAG: phosphate ABC transporter permease subunit PstC [Eubacteriales bacterium]